MMAKMSSGPAAHQRHLRNLLLDRRFQLKYAGYFVGIALLLSLSLGVALYETSRTVIDQSQRAVSQGERVVAHGKEALEESRKVSAVVQMNIVNDPIYGENPALREAFDRDARAQDARLARQQQRLRAQAASLKQQAHALRDRQRTALVSLAVALCLFVLLVGLAGIVVTHRVAGPVFKMKRLVRALGEGQLPEPGRLRRHDELVEFFETFDEAVRKLRDGRQRQLILVEQAIEDLGGEPSRARQALAELSEQLRTSLGR